MKSTGTCRWYERDAERIMQKLKLREPELSRAGTIKNIARISRSIVRDADAQNVTTEDKVECIVTELLFNDVSRAKIKRDALDWADEILYLRFRRYGDDTYRNKPKRLVNPRLELLSCADYAPISYVVDDGKKGRENVKEAVRKGLVENFALHIIGDAQDKYESQLYED